MGHPTTTSSNPFEAAIAPLLAATCPPAAARRRTKTSVPPSDVGHLLASLLDFRGSVQLADCLADLEAAQPASPQANASVDEGCEARRHAIRSRLEQRFSQLGERWHKVFDDPFQRRNRLPDGARVRAVLQETGAWTTRCGAGVEQAARILALSFLELFDNQVAYGRGVLSDVREELLPELRTLSARAEVLVRLDQVLRESTRHGVSALFGRLQPAFTTSFARDLAVALTVLPPEPSPEHLAMWERPAGWLHHQAMQTGALVAAVLGHEQDRLEALVEACIEAS